MGEKRSRDFFHLLNNENNRGELKVFFSFNLYKQLESGKEVVAQEEKKKNKHTVCACTVIRGPQSITGTQLIKTVR